MKKVKMYYPQKKKRELTEVEKEEIRKHSEKGKGNVYELAEEFGCSTSQVAGVKSTMNRG